MMPMNVTRNVAPTGLRRGTRRLAAILHLVAGWLACGWAATGMAMAQGPWSETVLLDFANSAPKGADPSARVFRDSAGNLDGTAQIGGTGNSGVVYRVKAGGPDCGAI